MRSKAEMEQHILDLVDEGDMDCIIAAWNRYYDNVQFFYMTEFDSYVKQRNAIEIAERVANGECFYADDAYFMADTRSVHYKVIKSMSKDGVCRFIRDVLTDPGRW